MSSLSLSDDEEDDIDVTSTTAPDTEETPNQEQITLPAPEPHDTSTSSIDLDAEDQNEEEPSETEPSSSSPSFEEPKEKILFDTSIKDDSQRKNSDDNDLMNLSQDSQIESQRSSVTLNTSEEKDAGENEDNGDEEAEKNDPEMEVEQASLPIKTLPPGQSTSESLAELGLSPYEINKQLQREASARNKREVEEEERERMQVLVSNFTEDQLDRYEMYRRAAFPKAAIKRLMQVITGNSVSQNAVIAMSGIAKVFIGEIVEEALDVEERWGDLGPIQPKHIREAVRILRQKRGVPKCNTYRMNPYHL